MDGAMQSIEIQIDDLISFRLHSGQTYQGKRMEQLIASIQEDGLLSPIIVRKIDNDKYEIISGHNRCEAMKAMGKKTIAAYVRTDLSDEAAEQLYYNSNLNQQTFSDWSYSQKIDAIRYIVKLIKMSSKQGVRTDLTPKGGQGNDAPTSVSDRQKLQGSPSKTTTRDKMSRQFGIAPATLGKYRSIIKLDEDLVTKIGQLLDQRRITFEFAYRLSKLGSEEARIILQRCENNAEPQITVDILKKLCEKRKSKGSTLSEDEILAILGILRPVHREEPR